MCPLAPGLVVASNSFCRLASALITAMASCAERTATVSVKDYVQLYMASRAEHDKRDATGILQLFPCPWYMDTPILIQRKNLKWFMVN